ncbi:hypothetical protein CRG98_046627 [Punica granatum]|uniref:Uncharacterized protein n=1 Tax=Punica granatum TaxID=22663 RepID=A0A2I0HMN3_PUNGR|nr:hypothetical protein CRG98_046627 [Punica granatum]
MTSILIWTKIEGKERVGNPNRGKRAPTTPIGGDGCDRGLTVGIERIPNLRVLPVSRVGASTPVTIPDWGHWGPTPIGIVGAFSNFDYI